MTDAATFRRAADHIDEMANKLEGSRWFSDRIFWKIGSTRGMSDGWWHEVRDDQGTVALSSEQDDSASTDTAADRVAWIVALGPHIAPHLATVLRVAADDAEMIGTDYQMLGLALAVLGEETS